MKNNYNLVENFETIYRDFRLKLYRLMFSSLGEREGSLTATEFFSVETIGLMGCPTVGEFAEALKVTSSHAAYKVKQLVEKGYVNRVPTEDKRSFRLEVTQKFKKYYHENNAYGAYIFEKLSKTLSDEELNFCGELFEKFVKTLKEENKNG